MRLLRTSPMTFRNLSTRSTTLVVSTQPWAISARNSSKIVIPGRRSNQQPDPRPPQGAHSTGEPNREGRHGEDRPEKHDFRDGERRRRKLDERRHDRERKRCADLEANPFEHAADLQINVCRRNPKGTACLLVVLKRKG